MSDGHRVNLCRSAHQLPRRRIGIVGVEVIRHPNDDRGRCAWTDAAGDYSLMLARAV